MSVRLKAGMLLSVLATALLVSSFTATTAQTAGGPGRAHTAVLEGNYRVNLSCAFSDNTTTSERVERVQRIEFHPEYIVIIDQTDVGRVVPVHALKHLGWEPS